MTNHSEPKPPLDRWIMRPWKEGGVPVSFLGGQGPVIMLRKHEASDHHWRWETRSVDGRFASGGVSSSINEALIDAERAFDNARQI